MKRKAIIILGTFLLLLSTVMLQAQQVKVKQPRAGTAGSWRLLGTVQAGFSADHDKVANEK